MRSDTSLRGAASLPRAFPTMRRASRQGPRLVYRAPLRRVLLVRRLGRGHVLCQTPGTPLLRTVKTRLGLPPPHPRKGPQPPGPRRRPPLTSPESPAPGGCALTAPEPPHCDRHKDRIGAPPGANTGSGANFALTGRCSPSGSRERQNLTFRGGGRFGCAGELGTDRPAQCRRGSPCCDTARPGTEKGTAAPAPAPKGVSDPAWRAAAVLEMPVRAIAPAAPRNGRAASSVSPRLTLGTRPLLGDEAALVAQAPTPSEVTCASLWNWLRARRSRWHSLGPHHLRPRGHKPLRVRTFQF